MLLPEDGRTWPVNALQVRCPRIPINVLICRYYTWWGSVSYTWTDHFSRVCDLGQDKEKEWKSHRIIEIGKDLQDYLVHLNGSTCFVNPYVHNIGPNLHWIISHEPLPINQIEFKLHIRPDTLKALIWVKVKR